MNRLSASLAVLLLAGSSGAAPAAQQGGAAEVLSAEVLRVNGQAYRLDGIDAPEPGQLCWVQNNLYDCGMVARTALQDLTAGATVTCTPIPGGEEADARPARCFAESYDLSEGMVYTGWAMADRKRGRRYLKLEQGASEERRGLWRGRFVMPWSWRAGERLPEEQP